jgi:hypothetical protein
MVVLEDVERPDRRELGRQVSSDDLEEAVRVGEVLESMLAKIAQTHPFRHILCHEALSHVGQ